MKTPSWIRKLAPTLVIVGIAGGAYLWISRKAPTPAIFDETVTIEQASQRAEQAGQVVLAVVTADFCPTCQGYKRTTLNDPKLASWVEGHAQTVYLEWERDEDRIAQLGVGAFPATVVLDDNGSVLDSRYGSISTPELIDFLEQAYASALDRRNAPPASNQDAEQSAPGAPDAPAT